MFNDIVYPYYYICFFTIAHSLVFISVAYYLSRTLTPKLWVKRPFLYTVPLILIPSIYEYVIGDPRSASRLFFSLVIQFIILLVFYNDKLSYRLGSWGFVLSILCVSEWLVCLVIWNCIIPVFFKQYALEYPELVGSPSITLPELCINILPSIFIECLLAILLVKIWNHIAHHINLMVFLKTGGCSFILYSGMLMVLPEVLGNLGWLLFLIITFFLCLFILDGMHRIRLSLNKAHIDKKRKELLEQDLNYYEKIEEQNLKIRRLNHDVNNHLQAIHFLISQGNNKEAKKYIREILGVLSQ